VVDEFGDQIIRFAPNQPLPEGWRVVQLDSGHYMGTDGNLETAITVNRFHARKWCWDISDKRARSSTGAKR
jgi:hypothetical protein